MAVAISLGLAQKTVHVFNARLQLAYRAMID
jgi:hypothetical protein